MAREKEEVLKFEAIRPFGPTIVKGKMPNTLVKLMDDKASEMFNDKESDNIVLCSKKKFE